MNWGISQGVYWAYWGCLCNGGCTMMLHKADRAYGRGGAALTHILAPQVHVIGPAHPAASVLLKLACTTTSAQDISTQQL